MSRDSKSSARDIPNSCGRCFVVTTISTKCFRFMRTAITSPFPAEPRPASTSSRSFSATVPNFRRRLPASTDRARCLRLSHRLGDQPGHLSRSEPSFGSRVPPRLCPSVLPCRNDIQGKNSCQARKNAVGRKNLAPANLFVISYLYGLLFAMCAPGYEKESQTTVA